MPKNGPKNGRVRESFWPKIILSSSTYVDDDKMILGQKDSRTLPFFGPFLGIFDHF